MHLGRKPDQRNGANVETVGIIDGESIGSCTVSGKY